MWEASGLPYPQLVDELVQLAIERHRRRRRRTIGDSAARKNAEQLTAQSGERGDRHIDAESRAGASRSVATPITIE